MTEIGDNDSGRDYVRLEFLKLELDPDGLNKKAKWDMYFVLCTEHPTEPSKDVVTTFPSEPIDFTREDANVVRFGHRESDGREGQEVYFGPMPEDGRIRMQVRALQSKEKQRNTGSVLRQVSSFADENVVRSLGLDKSPEPWVQAAVIANKGAGLVGEILEKTGDKDRGSATLDEAFDDAEFETRGSVKRVVRFQGGDVELAYRWSVVRATKGSDSSDERGNVISSRTVRAQDLDRPQPDRGQDARRETHRNQERPVAPLRDGQPDHGRPDRRGPELRNGEPRRDGPHQRTPPRQGMGEHRRGPGGPARRGNR